MRKLMIVMMVLAMSSQAFSMGHPRNIFAAHKKLKAKKIVSTTSKQPAPNSHLSSDQCKVSFRECVAKVVSDAAARVVYNSVLIK